MLQIFERITRLLAVRYLRMMLLRVHLDKFKRIYSIEKSRNTPDQAPVLQSQYIFIDGLESSLCHSMVFNSLSWHLKTYMSWPYGRVFMNDQQSVFQSLKPDFESFPQILTNWKQCFRTVLESKDGEIKSSVCSLERKAVWALACFKKAVFYRKMVLPAREKHLPLSWGIVSLRP